MLLDDNVTVRDFGLDDIEPMLEYWLSPDNIAYHQIRGTDPAMWIDPDRERRAMTAVVATPIPHRNHSAAVVLYRRNPVGHVLLNDLRDEDRCRMHFHMWRHKIRRTTLTDTLNLTQSMVIAALAYFFDTHEVRSIVGDVAVSNRPANFVLKTMGIVPSDTVEEAYLGKKQSYNRYIFVRGTV